MTYEQYTQNIKAIVDHASKMLQAAKTEEEKLNIVIAQNKMIKAIVNIYENK